MQAHDIMSKQTQPAGIDEPITGDHPHIRLFDQVQLAT